MSKTEKSVPAGIAVHPDCPRASNYAPTWVFDTGMGWPALWATEALAEKMRIEPGMRVLDLGCGKASSSVFVAREFGASVWAAELWISPSENYRMIQTQGLADKVFPVKADVRTLPFAHEYFDAIMSIGAYHYFGSDDYLLMDLVRFLKPGGQIGLVSPGFNREFSRDEIPPHLQKAYRDDGYGHGWYAFHNPEWWHWHWEKTGLVDIEVADMVPGGWEKWLQYDEITDQLLGRSTPSQTLEVLRQDQGRHIGFVRVVARRPEVA